MLGRSVFGAARKRTGLASGKNQRPRPARTRRTRSRAASFQSGWAKWKPASGRRPADHAAALEQQLGVRAQGERAELGHPCASPAGRRACRQASRRARMKSRWGKGMGAARLTGPSRSSRVDEEVRRARTKSWSWIQETYWRPPATGPPRPRRVSQDKHVEDAAAVRAHHHRRAQGHLAGVRGVGLRLRALPVLRDLDAVRPVLRHAGLGAADEAGRLVVRRRRSGGRRWSRCSSAARRAAGVRPRRWPRRPPGSSPPASPSWPAGSRAV